MRSRIPPAARSHEEFPIQENQTKDIVRVASYHRRDFPLAVVRFNPRETDPHRRSLAAPFTRPPGTGLGDLESLPLEILCEVSRLLDVASVSSLGRVSRRGRQVVAAIPEYAIVARYALDALRVVFRLGLLPHFTAVDLYNALCARDCRLCGKFGGFVFLPTLWRCCFECIQFKPELQIVTLAYLRSHAGMTELRLRELEVPIVRSTPGIYSMEERPWKRRLRLVATETIPEVYSQARMLSSHRNPADPPPIHRFMVATALPFVDPRTFEVQHGVCCKGCQIAVEKDLIGRNVEDYDLRDRVYSNEGFIRHFKWCAEAQALWASSQGGTVRVEEPESTRRGGYFADRDDTLPS